MDASGAQKSKLLEHRAVVEPRTLKSCRACTRGLFHPKNEDQLPSPASLGALFLCCDSSQNEKELVTKERTPSFHRSLPRSSEGKSLDEPVHQGDGLLVMERSGSSVGPRSPSLPRNLHAAHIRKQCRKTSPESSSYNHAGNQGTQQTSSRLCEQRGSPTANTDLFSTVYVPRSKTRRERLPLSTKEMPQVFSLPKTTATPCSVKNMPGKNQQQQSSNEEEKKAASQALLTSHRLKDLNQKPHESVNSGASLSQPQVLQGGNKPLTNPLASQRRADIKERLDEKKKWAHSLPSIPTPKDETLEPAIPKVQQKKPSLPAIQTPISLANSALPASSLHSTTSPEQLTPPKIAEELYTLHSVSGQNQTRAAQQRHCAFRSHETTSDVSDSESGPPTVAKIFRLTRQQTALGKTLTDDDVRSTNRLLSEMHSTFGALLRQRTMSHQIFSNAS